MIWVLSKDWNFIGYKKCHEQSHGSRRMLVVDKESDGPIRLEQRTGPRVGPGRVQRRMVKGTYIMVRWWKGLTHTEDYVLYLISKNNPRKFSSYEQQGPGL